MPGGFDSHSLPPPFCSPRIYPKATLRMIVHGFEFPDDVYLLVEHQVWVRRDADGAATVGITALGIHLGGEIYMCRVKPVGTRVEQARSIGIVELAKTIISVKAPVTGVIESVNPALEQTPELIHLDPYGKGWLARVRVEDFGRDESLLVRAALAAEAVSNYYATAPKPHERNAE